MTDDNGDFKAGKIAAATILAAGSFLGGVKTGEAKTQFNLHFNRDDAVSRAAEILGRDRAEVDPIIKAYEEALAEKGLWETRAQQEAEAKRLQNIR